MFYADPVITDAVSSFTTCRKTSLESTSTWFQYQLTDEPEIQEPHVYSSSEWMLDTLQVSIVQVDIWPKEGRKVEEQSRLLYQQELHINLVGVSVRT